MTHHWSANLYILAQVDPEEWEDETGTDVTNFPFEFKKRGKRRKKKKEERNEKSPERFIED